MAISSADIQKQSFSIDRKGYDVDEVDVFLERVASEIDDMNSVITQLEDGFEQETEAPVDNSLSEELAEKNKVIVSLEAELEEKKANDQAIAQALIIAQRSADELIESANNKADEIRQDAEDEAQRIIDKANAEKDRIIEEIEKLEDEREETRADYQGILKDFIGDASKKLSDITAAGNSVTTSAHARPVAGARGGQTKGQAPVRKNEAGVRAATYTTPPASAAAVVVPATPKPSQVEKDFSGFGAADDSFEFDDID